MKKQLLTGVALIFALAINAQVTLLKDINDGASDSNPNETFVYNGKAYFQADDSSALNTGGVDYGDELWVTDGTAEGTMLLKNIRGTVETEDAFSSSQPEGFFEYNGTLYFSATIDNPAGGGMSQLFRLNSAGDDTEEVAGVPGFYRSCELGGLIYFVYEPGPGQDNVLYVFDGTNAAPVTNNSLETRGTENIFVNTSSTSPGRIVAFNNKIYFSATMSLDNVSADPAENIGAELYSYDPATGIFELVDDISEGLNTSGTGAAGSGISNLVVVNGSLYFEAYTGSYLYETDGTETGTKRVAAAETAGVRSVLSFYNWNDKLYMEGDDGNSVDQLWVYDPVAETITPVSTNVEENHDPAFFTPIGSDLFYAGSIDDDDGDLSIFKLDGGTNQITLVEATRDLDCEHLYSLNGKLYFEGDDDGASNLYGTELYVLDPTTLSVSNKELMGIATAYPNPATNHITVDKSLVNGNYNIYDVTGKVVKQGVLQSQKLDFNFTTGLYIFKAQTNSGYYTQKLVVK